jgi:hypothetical protein
VPILTLALCGAASIAGAIYLVAAFRDGQAGRRDAERVKFRVATAALALGALLFFATVALTA